MAAATTAQGTEGLPIRLGAAFFIMGFVATASQVLLLRRLLSVLYGNEMVVGVALAVWMVGTGAGSLAAGVWGTRANARSGLAAAALVSIALLPLTTLATYAVRAIEGAMVRRTTRVTSWSAGVNSDPSCGTITTPRTSKTRARATAAQRRFTKNRTSGM